MPGREGWLGFRYPFIGEYHSEIAKGTVIAE
jgi:hypothetical protein